MKNSVTTFLAAKGRERLTMLTAYDYMTARLEDQAGVNAILVGDSLGMTVLGYSDTLSVTMEDMLHHCLAVSRGVGQALLVCDMPYMSYHVSVAEAVRNAGRLVAEGRAQAVKLEGGGDFVPEIAAMVRASIPVMGHLGLTPQSVNALGGFKVQGKSLAAAQKLLDDARALQDAGVFSMVLEGIPAGLGARITDELEVPTIGIGAGPGCDGQVLVWQDMLGLSENLPKFVKCFAPLGEAMCGAFKAYAEAVRAGTFPSSENCYAWEDEAEVLAKLR